MGYPVKIQRVEGGKTKSFYINFPVCVAEACNIEKGEKMEWIVEDKNSFTLQRIKKSPLKKPKETSVTKVVRVKNVGKYSTTRRFRP